MCLLSLFPFRHHPNPLVPTDTLLISHIHRPHSAPHTATAWGFLSACPSKSPKKQHLGRPPASAKPLQKLSPLISELVQSHIQEKPNAQSSGCAGQHAVQGEQGRRPGQARESIFQHRSKPLVTSSILTIPKLPFFPTSPFLMPLAPAVWFPLL